MKKGKIKQRRLKNMGKYLTHSDLSVKNFLFQRIELSEYLHFYISKYSVCQFVISFNPDKFQICLASEW